MKQSTFSCLSLSLFAAILLAVTAGCGNDNSSPAGETNTAATESTPAPSNTASSTTSFDAVTSKLDRGGNLFAYLETRQWTEGLSGKVDGWRDLILSMPNVTENDRTEINQVFDVITEAIRRSGIESVDGVGLSGIEFEPGLFQTKIFAHRLEGSSPGGMWTLFGESVRPLNELDFLPADTAWAAFSDVELHALWNGVTAMLADSGIPELQEGPQQIQAMVEGATGKTLDQLLGSLGGSMGGFLTLDSETMIQIPMGEEGMEIPAPGLVIALKVQDESLFDLIESMLAGNEQVERIDEAGLRMRIMPVPAPIPMEIKLAVARTGDYLFIASHDNLIRDLLAVRDGTQQGLKSNSEFQRLAAGMPTEGNSFSFTSERLAETIRNVQMASLQSNPQFAGDPGMHSFMEKIMSFGGGGGAYSVGQSRPDGWLTTMHGTQSPATMVALPLVVFPAAMVTGFTLPALAQAKDKAASISCVNNLKQLGLGVRIYANENEGNFPGNFQLIQDAIGVPWIFICPESPLSPEKEFLTWEDLDEATISYEYLGDGLTEESDPGTVIWRCKFHGHECMADGSVMQALQP